jgi:hypothetical protein
MSGVRDHAEDTMIKKGTRPRHRRRERDERMERGKAQLELELERQTSGVLGHSGVIEWVAN